jgi:class 3 adenylate cyclase
MRIGVHTGKIVAGIIGSKIVRYDIFGENVMIANKMESNGIAGKVVVSEHTMQIL